MDAVDQSNPRFVISPAEIARRKAAFDRLAVSTTVSAAVFAAVFLAATFPAPLLGVLALGVIFILSRLALALSFGRFARTVWTVSAASLIRLDARSRDEYGLDLIRRVRTKRTTAGGIREIRLELTGGRGIYVNGLDDFEAFREALLAGCPRADEGVSREKIDFDHPLFYIGFGALLGLLIALAVRAALFAPRLDPRYVKIALAVYLLAMGAYWLRAKPVSGRYGERSAISDCIIGWVVVCLGAGAALTALLQL